MITLNGWVGMAWVTGLTMKATWNKKRFGKPHASCFVMLWKTPHDLESIWYKISIKGQIWIYYWKMSRMGFDGLDQCLSSSSWIWAIVCLQKLTHFWKWLMRVCTYSVVWYNTQVLSFTFFLIIYQMNLRELWEAAEDRGAWQCCDSWGRKESDMTEQLNWTELKNHR